MSCRQDVSSFDSPSHCSIGLPGRRLRSKYHMGASCAITKPEGDDAGATAKRAGLVTIEGALRDYGVAVDLWPAARGGQSRHRLANYFPVRIGPRPASVCAGWLAEIVSECTLIR